MTPEKLSGGSPGLSRRWRPHRLKPGLQPDSLTGRGYKWRVNRSETCADTSKGVTYGHHRVDRVWADCRVSGAIPDAWESAGRTCRHDRVRDRRRDCWWLSRHNPRV